jgi:hypothetical protein
MTLQELLDLTEVPLVLHLKRRWFNPFHDQRAVRKLSEVLANRSGVTISSFWPGTVRFIKRHYPALRSAFITYWPSYDLLFSHNLGASEYHAWWRGCSRGAAQRAAARKVRLIAFVAPPTEAAKRRLHTPGIHGVITDHVAFFSGRRPVAQPARPRSVRGSRRS